METVGRACSLKLIEPVEGELSLTSATITSTRRQATVEAPLQGLGSEVQWEE